MSTNISPLLWGESGWKFMHYITLSYPVNPTENDKQRMHDFFMLVRELLPCESCRYNLRDEYIKYPLTKEILDNKMKLVEWLNTIHNSVNIRLGKKVMPVSEMMDIYMNGNTNKYTFTMSSEMQLIIGIILVIITIIIILNVKNRVKS